MGAQLTVRELYDGGRIRRHECVRVGNDIGALHSNAESFGSRLCCALRVPVLHLTDTALKASAHDVKVDLEIATSGPAVAPSLDAINAELGKKGLPQATLYQPAAPTATSAPAVTTTPPPADGWPWWAIVTAAAGGAIVLMTALALVLLHGFRRRARQQLHEAAAAACVDKQAQAQVAPQPCCHTAAPVLHHKPH